MYMQNKIIKVISDISKITILEITSDKLNAQKRNAHELNK